MPQIYMYIEYFSGMIITRNSKKIMNINPKMHSREIVLIDFFDLLNNFSSEF